MANPTDSNDDPSRRLTRLEINKLVNRYIGVNGDYLGDFSYQKHHDFYLDLDLDIDPYNYDGTTRARFIKILSESTAAVQARILEGILERYPAESSEIRTKLHDEIEGWIARLKGAAAGHLQLIENALPVAARHEFEATNKHNEIMPINQFNPKRLVQIEELLDIEYEKLHEFEKAISLADGISQKIALRQQIKRDLSPRIRKLEQEYAEVLAAAVQPDTIPEREAEVLVAEVIDAITTTDRQKPANTPQEMVRLLAEIRDKLSEPGKSASAKLKINLPLIPLIASYEHRGRPHGRMAQGTRLFQTTTQ
jgi:hypothetical protein